MAPYPYDPNQPLHAEFSGEKAFGHVEALVGFGPRPAGSPALERSRHYLERELEAHGWVTRRDAFTDSTPLGPIEFVNLRARFGGGGEGGKAVDWEDRIQILIGSHYDTKYFADIRFTGANDGGSSSGALLELARVAATRPDFGRRLELIFFDGEEAFENYTATDGLYGSRHHAQQVIRRLPREKRPQAVVILDMIGEKDLMIKVPADTPPTLARDLFAAARDLGFERHFGRWPTAITDDHVPFLLEGVPAIDLIDLDYKAWHTSADDMDQIRPESLEITGRTTLHFLEKYQLAPNP